MPSGEKSVELLLGAADGVECLAQLSARERRQLFRTDQVIGCEAITNLLGMVIQPNLADICKRFPQ